MLWSIGNGRVFRVTDNEEEAMASRREGLTVHEVGKVEDISEIPLTSIVGRIGTDWYVKMRQDGD